MKLLHYYLLLAAMILGAVLGAALVDARDTLDVYCFLDQSGEWQIIDIDEEGKQTVLLRGDVAFKQCVLMTLSADEEEPIAI